MSENAIPDEVEATRRLWVVTVLCVLFCLALKVPTLQFPHEEPDEVVYWSVAERLLNDGHYTLRGAEVLPRLSARIYDRPLFHHPPLFAALLVPFVAADARSAAIVLSWLGHAMCVVAVGLFASRSFRRNAAPISGYVWIPLLAVATDPLLTFVSRKLWIDALMAGCIALSLACVHRSGDGRNRRGWILAGGVLMGLAGLAKVPGLLGAPVAAAMLWCDGRGTLRERLTRVAWFAVPCTLLTSPWFVLFRATYGVWLPGWLKPDEFALRNYPFVARAVGLPWYYYLSKLLLAQPLLIFAAFAAFARIRRPEQGNPAWSWTPALWFGLFLAVSTFQGATGYGFQMRYVAPLVPSIYVGLLAWPAARDLGESWWGRPLQVMALVWAAMTGALYLLTPRYDELLTLPELGGLLGF